MRSSDGPRGRLAEWYDVRVSHQKHAAAAWSPEATEDHGQIGSWHLLARPVGIGTSEFGRIGLHPLHPTADVDQD